MRSTIKAGVRQVHTFDNGIMVYDDHLVPVQRNRYMKRNVHETEEEDIFVKIVREIPADGCFLNIGSAVGYYPLLAKRLSPKLTILAVEPLEQHREFFIENAILNGFSPTDFAIYEEGISSSDGYARLADRGYGSSIIGDDKKVDRLNSLMKSLVKTLLLRGGSSIIGCKTQKIVRIRTITLDNLMSIIGRSVDLLQMDVQGFEVDVLKGSLRSLESGKIKTFLIGTHGREIHQECIAILRNHDYVIEHDEPETREQPDGIVVASKGLRRLS